MNLKKIKTIATFATGMISILAFSFACQKNPDLQGLPEEEDPVPVVTIDSDIITPVEEEEPEEEEVVYEETKEGFVRSELTNEWIDEKLENQRPIAVMVDNELTALDHYGVNQSSISTPFT